MALTVADKAAIMAKFARGEADTGSPEFKLPCCLLKLTTCNHTLNRHKDDHHSRRGLIRMVNQRRSLLDYLNRKDSARYAPIQHLGLRR